MSLYSCDILYCNRPKKWFCCKDCKAHTASASQDDCVTDNVHFIGSSVI